MTLHNLKFNEHPEIDPVHFALQFFEEPELLIVRHKLGKNELPHYHAHGKLLPLTRRDIQEAYATHPAKIANSSARPSSMKIGDDVGYQYCLNELHHWDDPHQAIVRLPEGKDLEWATALNLASTEHRERMKRPFHDIVAEISVSLTPVQFHNKAKKLCIRHYRQLGKQPGHHFVHSVRMAVFDRDPKFEDHIASFY